MTTTTDIQLFEARLADLDRLLAENEARLDAAPPHAGATRNYLRQELESERRDLQQDRATTSIKLEDARGELERTVSSFRRRRKVNADPETVERDRRIEAAVAEQTANAERFASKLESEGDHRQARIWRASIPDIRPRVLREFGLSR